MKDQDGGAFPELTANNARIAEAPQGVLSRERENEGEESVEIAVDTARLLEASRQNGQD